MGKVTPFYKVNVVYCMNLWVQKENRDPCSVTTGQTINTNSSDALNAIKEFFDNQGNKEEDNDNQGFLRRLFR